MRCATDRLNTQMTRKMHREQVRTTASRTTKVRESLLASPNAGDDPASPQSICCRTLKILRRRHFMASLCTILLFTKLLAWRSSGSSDRIYTNQCDRNSTYNLSTAGSAKAGISARICIYSTTLLSNLPVQKHNLLFIYLQLHPLRSPHTSYFTSLHLYLRLV